jgi:hypothetical protein
MPLGTERHVDGAGSGAHCSIGRMKRLIAGLAGLAGIAWFRRRKPAQPDPAEELKAKLAEAREATDEREEFEAGEKPVDEVPDDVDTRRREVHDRARAAIDDLRSE